MSYDLMVFDPASAPQDKSAFEAWVDAEMSGPDAALDASKCTDRLTAWFQAFCEFFPPLNGPNAVSDDRIDDPEVTDFTLMPGAIYASFRWSVTEAALAKLASLAEQHGLGIYDPQGGTCIYPD